MASELIEIEEARRLVLRSVAPIGLEPVAVGEALGRVLAEPITAEEAIPGFDNSAMDGYAVRASGLAAASPDSPVALELVGESRAGHPAGEALAPGEAIAISTGAMVPSGADAVVRLEDSDGARAGSVAIRAPVDPGANIRRAGEDVEPGARVLDPGDDLGPAEIGVLAALGRTRVACARPPKVAVLTTGDELQEPGEPLRAGAIRNSNAHALAALVVRAGAELSHTGLVADTPEATEAAIGRALSADVTIISGGVSVGPHDHVRPALERLGAEQVFWGVALRPGKPTYFGVAPTMPGTGPARGLVFGLPGNPVSAMVTFLLFVRPAIRAALGADPERGRRASAILDRDYSKQPGRAHLLRCRLELADDGWHAIPAEQQGSHVLTSMLGAEAFAIVPAPSAGIAAGERVEIELL